MVATLIKVQFTYLYALTMDGPNGSKNLWLTGEVKNRNDLITAWICSAIEC